MHVSIEFTVFVSALLVLLGLVNSQPIGSRRVFVLTKTNAESADFFNVVKSQSMNKNLARSQVKTNYSDFDPGVSLILVDRTPSYFLSVLLHKLLSFGVFERRNVEKTEIAADSKACLSKRSNFVAPLNVLNAEFLVVDKLRLISQRKVLSKCDSRRSDPSLQDRLLSTFVLGLLNEVFLECVVVLRWLEGKTWTGRADRGPSECQLGRLGMVN